MLASHNNSSLSIHHWLHMALFLFCFLNLNAQDALQKELERAQSHIYKKSPQEAVDLSLEIYEKATDLNTQISILITLVNAYTALHENDKAMTYAIKAKDIAKASKNIHLQARTLGLLGEQYQLYHLNSISREYLKQAEKLLNNSNLTSEMVAISQGNIYAVIGNSYKAQIDCKYAIENYDKAITAYKSVPSSSSAQNNLALAYVEKGNCLLETKDFENAKINFNNAKNIASANGLLEYLNYAELGLAKIETINKQFDLSTKRLIALTKDSLSFAQTNVQIQTYALLKRNYKQLDDTKAYLITQKKYAESLERINEVESANFQQILRFIQNTTFHNKPNNNIRKIIIYTLGGVLILISVFEIKRYFQVYKQEQSKE